MKYLTLALSAVVGLTASVASAQVPVPLAYDTYPPSSVSYYTGPGNTCAGDVMRLVPTWSALDTIDNIRVLFVATAAGTYNVAIGYGSGYVFPNSIPCPTVTSPVTVSAAGVYEVEVCFTNPVQIGAADQVVAVHTDSAAFSVAYADQAATPAGTDIPDNMFMIDTNVNHVLEPGPPVNEAYNFGPSPAHWNVAMQIRTGCTPAPLFTCGNGSSVSVRPVNMTAVEQKTLLSTRINNKL